MKRTHKPAKQTKLTDEQVQSLVIVHITKRDRDWWLSGIERLAAFQETKSAIPYRVTKQMFFDAVKQYCGWFGKRERFPPLPLEDSWLTPRGWDKIRGAVLSLREEITHVGIRTALVIVSSRVQCNELVLRGLPSHLHFWERDELLLAAADQTESPTRSPIRADPDKWGK